jgi:hypothetical protein
MVVMNSLEIANYALLHNPWRARMHLVSNTAVAAAGVIPFSAIDFDPGNACTTGAAAKYTVQTDGYYLVSVSAQNITTAVVFYCTIAQNGTTIVFGSDTNASGVSEISVVSTIVKCAAGDTIQAISGATTTLVGSTTTTYLSISWIAPA